jgi:hypothetical protein
LTFFCEPTTRPTLADTFYGSGGLLAGGAISDALKRLLDSLGYDRTGDIDSTKCRAFLRIEATRIVDGLAQLLIVIFVLCWLWAAWSVVRKS